MSRISIIATRITALLVVLSAAVSSAPVYFRAPTRNQEPAGQPNQEPTRESKAEAARQAFAQAQQLSKQRSAESLQKAIEKYQEALQLYRSIGDRGGEALTLNNLGFSYQLIGENQKALDSYQQALSTYRASNDSSGEASTLNNLAAVYYGLGDRQKALDCLNQALPIFRASGDRSGEADAINNMGAIYDQLGDKPKARASYEQALTLYRAIGDQSSTAGALNNIGYLYNAAGERRKAVEFYQQALQLQKLLGDRRGEAVTLNNLGSVYDSLGERNKALELYGQSLLLRRAVGDRGGEANTLNNLAAVYDELGDKKQALEFYKDALTLYRATANRAGEAGTLNNIGSLNSVLGDKQSALEFYAQALTVLRATGDRQGEAAALNNIGAVHNALGDKQKALGFYNQALALCREISDRRGEAVALNNLGTVYNSTGESQKALEHYRLVLEIDRVIGDRRGEAITLSNVGFVYEALGDQQRALEHYHQALPLHEATGDLIGEANTLNNLMHLWRLRSAGPAVFYGKRAVNLLQQIRSNIRGFEKELQKTFLRSREDTYRTLADLLIATGRLPEAQQVLQMLKEEEYFEFVRRDGIEASSLTVHAELSSEEVLLERRYREIADRVTAIGAEYGQLREKQARTAEEDQRLAKLEEDLAIANRAFQKFLDDIDKTFSESAKGSEKVFQLRESQGLMETLRDLGPGAVALYTVVGEDKYRVILVTPEVQKAYQTSIGAADLNRKVLALREALQNPRADPRPLAQELYKILIGSELARDLQQAKAQTLMWSLDGVLRYLPVGALHDRQKYLVESYRNVVFTPASQSRLKDAVSSKWKALGFGVSKAQPGFNALPGVREELDGIIREENATGQTRGGVLAGKVMLDEAFTATAMQAALRQRYPVVHIASHFSFKPGNEVDSFLLLGDGSHLTLAQIKSLPNVFSGVDLLTLSACDTATGGAGASGKEVEGFGVLAQRQGAKAVLATLWPVADESTQLLMREFYRLREANPDWAKAEALRQAQLELLTGKGAGGAKTKVDKSGRQDEKTNRAEIVAGVKPEHGANQPVFTPDPKLPFAHPYYWAPFILIGNWK
ncbi:MAG: CHAT domain-containing protein [Pyrinomonadaceae bacterium]